MKTLITLIAFQALFSTFLMVSNKKKEAFDKLLVYFLGFIVLYFLTKLGLLFIGRNNIYYQLPTSYSFVFGPMLFLLTKRMLSEKLNKKHAAIHFLPFTVYTIYFVFVLFIIKSDSYTFVIQLYKKLAYLELISMVVYAIFCLKLIKRTATEKKKERYNLVKLMSVLLISYSTLILILIILQVSFHFNINLRLSYIFILFMVCAIIYYKLINKEEPIISEKSKYKNSSLSPKELNEYKVQLNRVVVAKKLYENPDLTLSELSKLTGIPTHHLSQLLNTKLNKNFYQYINEYRVQDVIHKIKNASTSDNIIDLALSSGFNSKSSFNSYFKKVTGKTPSQYKKEIDFNH